MSDHVISEPTPKLSRWVAVIASAVAAIAIAMAGWSLLHPLRASNTATDPQVTDAAARACAAYNTVRSAVSLQTHAELGPDPVAKQAVAANARLSMAAGGAYLLAHLDPATPAPLAVAIRSLADGLQAITLNALAGMTNDDPAQAARLHDAETASSRAAGLCSLPAPLLFGGMMGP
jgi:hypothetical protein